MDGESPQDTASPPGSTARNGPSRPAAGAPRRPESVFGDLVPGLDRFVKVRLEGGMLVTDEAEDVMEGEPLEITGILVEIGSESVQFGEQAFGFHGDEA